MTARVAFLVVAVALSSGCVVVDPGASSSPTTEPITPAPFPSEPPPSGSPPPLGYVPVVRVTSTLVRTYENGTTWEPPFPGYHGCGDAFAIDEAAERVLVSNYSQGWEDPNHDYRAYPRSATDQARIAISLQHRAPGDFYRNNHLVLPSSAPNTTLLPMSNVAPFNVSLHIAAGQVHVNSTLVPQDQRLDFVFDYKWRRSDGVVLNVRETVSVTYLGDWYKPFGERPDHICV